MNNRLAERISALNLDEIASHIVKERRWKPNRLLEALNGYFQFLYLAGEYPSNTVVPWSRDIDVIWHAHILETEKYDADCKNLFGRFIHHKRSDKEKADPAKTINLLQRAFMAPPEWARITGAEIRRIKRSSCRS